MCRGATSCSAALFPDKLRARLTPTPLWATDRWSQQRQHLVWYLLFETQPLWLCHAKLNEKERVTIREGMWFWRPRLSNGVTGAGSLPDMSRAMLSLWAATMQSLFLSWFNCSTDTEGHVIAVRQMEINIPSFRVLLPCCFALVFVFFSEEMTTDWKNYSRSLIHFRHRAVIYLYIHSFNIYRVVIMLYLSNIAADRLTCALPSRLSLTFHGRRPHF